MTNTYIITGGSKGIGLAVVERLLRDGNAVICLSRTSGSLPIENSRLKFIECDLGNSDTRQQAFRLALEDQESLAGIVNNCAGPSPLSFEHSGIQDYQDALNTHLFAADELLRVSLPALQKFNGSKIVNIVSVTARSPLEGLISSNLLRGAIINWSKTLSIELAKFNINVNNVLPGYTLTSRLQEVLTKKATSSQASLENVKQSLLKDIPLKRFGTPQEIANVVNFLLSSEASYITGTSIPVDGGWTRSV